MAYARDIYYVADKSGIRAVVNSGQHTVPLEFRGAPAKDPFRILVLGESLQIADAATGQIVTWPLLVPITVEVEARHYLNDTLGTLYLHLWELGVLPTEEVELPYQRPEGTCGADVECILKARKLLSKSTRSAEKILCGMNPSYCVANKLTRVPPKGKLLIPLVPFESYLWVDQRPLGESSLGRTIEYWIPDPKLRKQVDPELLRRLNPEIKEPNILSVRQKNLKVRIPIERYRYYFSVPRVELYNEELELLRIVKSDSRLTLRSTEVRSFGGPAPSAPQESGARSAEDLKPEYGEVLKNLGYHEIHRAWYGDGAMQTIAVTESRLDCRHPVFFNDQRGAFVPPTPTCTEPGGEVKGLVVGWETTPVWHGTCVASLAGARQAPYGLPPAPHVELRQVTLGEIRNDVTSIVHKRKESPFVVNVSQGDSGDAWEQSWRNLFNDYWLKKVLFVAAAGNAAQPLSDSKEFPALLARKFPNVISVGALAKDGKSLWEKTLPDGTLIGSNHGPDVEIQAPGEAIPCAVEVLQNDGATTLYSLGEGTSMAAPLVSVAAALLLQKGLNPAETKARLLATAEPTPETRNGQLVAAFGKLSFGRALRDPTKLYARFVDPRKDPNSSDDEGELTIDAAGDSEEVRIVTPPNTRSRTIRASDILAIRRLKPDAENEERYRVVMFENSQQAEVLPSVRILGCFSYTSTRDGRKRVLRFSAAGSCPQINEPGIEVRTDLDDLIGQRALAR